MTKRKLAGWVNVGTREKDTFHGNMIGIRKWFFLDEHVSFFGWKRESAAAALMKNVNDYRKHETGKNKHVNARSEGVKELFNWKLLLAVAMRSMSKKILEFLS